VGTGALALKGWVGSAAPEMQLPHASLKSGTQCLMSLLLGIEA